MKHTYDYERWTNPASALDPRFHHMSFAVFRTDDAEPGRVVAARLPDCREMAVGDSLFAKLRLSGEAVDFCMRANRATAPLFVLSDRGLGILSLRYHFHACMGIYLHVHTRPESGARLLNSGACGGVGRDGLTVSRRVQAVGDAVTAQDTASYAALADAWCTVQAIDGCLFAPAGKSLVRVRDLQMAMERMAAFVGCRLTVHHGARTGEDACAVSLDAEHEGRISEASDHVRWVRCYRPMLLECLLLCLLAEIRLCAANHGATCRIGSWDGTDGGHLCIALRYVLDPTAVTRAAMTEQMCVRAHLLAMADAEGLHMRFSDMPCWLSADTLGTPTEPTVQTITLEWLTDPTVRLTSDLKSRPHIGEDEAHMRPWGE